MLRGNSMQVIYPRKQQAPNKPLSVSLLQRAAINPTSRHSAPPIVHEVLRSPGQPLDAATRAFMEPRFGLDLSGVRVHTDRKAAESARAVNALAYTVGASVVMGAGQYDPHGSAGRGLLAHELTHVVQQDGASVPNDLAIGLPHDDYEQEAEQIGRTAFESSGIPIAVSSAPTRRVQGQFITPLGPGGGFGGLMERDRQNARRSMSTPIQVCARPLQSVLGAFANHAFVDAPPHRYGVITPLCAPTDGGPDNVLQGTVAQKWDNSPDPCGQSPVNCVPCLAKPGVSDVGQCLRAAFMAYNNPSLYRGFGPNSNTFAGTLARACCADMVPKPSVLGIVPGWDDPPAPARPGTCPPGPSCS